MFSGLYTTTSPPSFQRPRTALVARNSTPSVSSPRVPISKTAAYSWLQVQKIMESSGHSKLESTENEPAENNEQPRMMAHLTRNNSSSSSSSNSSVSSDSFSINNNDKPVS